MMRLYRIIGAFILFAGCLHAQPFERETSTIPISSGNAQFPFSWTGGMSTPNYQFVDIDGDGDFDLFIFDRDLSVEFYRNIGTPQQPKFVNATGDITLPKFYSWFRFVDSDGDGDYDLYTDDGSYGLSFYENIGTAHSPNFVLRTEGVFDILGTKVYSERSSVPAFADIDGDGDLDFFSINASVGTINYYENVGSRFAPAFKFITEKFQDIQIISGGLAADSIGREKPMHGTAAMMFADIDGNKTLDLIYGDLFALSIWLFRNDGTPQSPKLVKAADHFPPNSPVATSGFNMPSLVDIDGDGLPDLFVGVLSSFAGKRNFIFYKNIGTSSSPLFSPVTQDYLPMFDAGTNSHPAFADIDGDGLPDLFVGNLEGNISYLKNTGSKSVPAFTIVDSAFAGVSGDYAFAPAFVDIDGNGVLDLFVGTYSGHILFYRNIGTATTPQFQLTPSQLDTLRFGAYCSPAFADIDGDGLFDLLVGKSNGKISFYKNTGTKSSFSYSLVTDFFDSITAGQNSQPFLVDYNGDGKMDLFLGSADGTMQFFRNIGTKTSPHFTRESSNFIPGLTLAEAVPALVDIDNDGDLDLFIGNSKGGLYFYRNKAITGIHDGSVSLPFTFTLKQNFPNPFNPSTRIDYSIPQTDFVRLEVFDILGREVETLVQTTQERGGHSVDFDARRMPGGFYFYRLTSGGFAETKKMVLLR